MKNLYIVCLLIFSVIFSSCQEIIELDLESSDPVIVIYGCVTDAYDYQTIDVSSSAPYFDKNSNSTVSGAKVTITSSTGDYWLLEETSKQGTYHTQNKVSGEIGATYYLKVEYDFNKDGEEEIYEASSKLLAPPIIDSVSISPIDLFGVLSYNVNLSSQDNPGPDFYLYKIYVNDSLVTPLDKYTRLSDNLFEGEYMKDIPVYSLVDEESRDDIDKEDQHDVAFVYPGDRIVVESSRIESGYYDFIVECQNEIGGENPLFGGYPSNVSTNISNGGLGYFASFSSTFSYTEIPFLDK